MKSIRENYIYSLSFQLLRILTPLILTPYISRVLGADKIGIYSYTQSIVTYFILFGTAGMHMYAQREIAYAQNSKKKQSIIFYEIIILRSIMIIISLTLFFVFIKLYDKFKLLFLIQAFDIIGVALDVTWFYQGLEDFGKVVWRSIALKLCELVLTFLLVHNANDLYIYVAIRSFLSFVGYASLLFFLRQNLSKVHMNEIHFIRHIPGVLLMFIPQVALQIHQIADKTMIGLITGSSFENGYYEQSQKLIKVAVTIITSLSTVMMPRMAQTFKRGDKGQLIKYLYQTFGYVWFLGIPIMLGMIAITENMVPWFFGNGFERVTILLYVFSPLVLCIGLNNVIGIQYLLPTGRQSIYTLTLIIGAGLNVILNLILIKKFQSIGAAIASVIAEITITLLQFIIIKNEISLRNIVLISRKYFFAGIFMFILMLGLGKQLEPSLLNTFVMIVFGGGIYLIVLYSLNDYFLKKILTSIKIIFMDKKEK